MRPQRVFYRDHMAAEWQDSKKWDYMVTSLTIPQPLAPIVVSTERLAAVGQSERTGGRGQDAVRV